VHSSAAATELHVEISNSSKREVQLGELFVTLADTLVAGFDLSELLQTLIDQTIEFLPVDAAALLLAGPDGVLKVAAASSSQVKAVEVLILEAKASPCHSAYDSGEQTGAADVDSVKPEWDEYASIMSAAGFRSSHSTPMKLRTQTIGVLSMFSLYPYTPSDVDAAVAQALANAATISIIQMDAATRNNELSEQLQHALDSRVLIEQAKGVIAQTHTVPMDEAFTIIRDHARRTSSTLRDVSQEIIKQTLAV
jgi:GAF domain-containing protein